MELVVAEEKVESNASLRCPAVASQSFVEISRPFLTLLLGLVVDADKGGDVYDRVLMGILLVAINVVVSLVGLFTLVATLPCCGKKVEQVVHRMNMGSSSLEMSDLSPMGTPSLNSTVNPLSVEMVDLSKLNWNENKAARDGKMDGRRGRRRVKEGKPEKTGKGDYQKTRL